MKFAKQLETEAEDIPREWRPYLIRYKALKKIITKVTEEIERRGLSASLLHDCLYDNNLKYYFTGKKKKKKWQTVSNFFFFFFVKGNHLM